VAPDDLLAVVLGHLEKRLDDLASVEGRRRLVSEYRRLCSTLGRDVMVSVAGETFSGTVADITAEGHLLLDVGACIRTVTAGDVVHLRT
jgi:biotin-(acetyl-CoA carboxylase) ligase